MTERPQPSHRACHWTVQGRSLHLPGRLGAHEECGRELAALLAPC